ncbi:hypothetical protein Tco_1479258 [Tanacetum coccineum]
MKIRGTLKKSRNLANIKGSRLDTAKLQRYSDNMQDRPREFESNEITKELVLLMVKAAELMVKAVELKIRMHGDYFGMFIFELSNGEQCVMELEYSQNNALAKLPMLKLGE